MHSSSRHSPFSRTMLLLLLANRALWLSLLIYSASCLSSQPYNENPRGKIRSSSPIAAPETSRPQRGEQPQQQKHWFHLATCNVLLDLYCSDSLTVFLTFSHTLHTTTGPQDVSFVSSSGSSKGTKRKRPPTPLVDSTLLRFLSLQKQKQKVQQQQQQDTTTQSQAVIAQEVIQQQQSLLQSSWLGQYNRHLVAQSLLELQGVSESLALEAGDAVQRHALARTARRRLRLFLRKRDKLWGTTTTTMTNGNTLQEDDVLLQNVNYDLHQVIELLLEKGLTGTDICTILSHTPSVALMRPTGDFENNTLDTTVTRAFTCVLSESLQLRKYDARKVSTTVLYTYYASLRFYCSHSTLLLNRYYEIARDY